MGQYDRQAQSQRKHGPLPNSGAAKSPAPPPLQKPEWRGSGYVKKRAPRQNQATPSKPTPTLQEQKLPVELQQLILDIFRDRFLVTRDFDDWKGTLHDVNEALLQRDFGRAFGSDEFREAYALRWAPSRSLAYANVLACICDQWQDDRWVKRVIGHVSHSAPARVVCFGGGAAEVMAFAALIRYLHPGSAGRPLQSQSGEPDDATTYQTNSSLIDLHLLDSADWASVISKLETGITTPPVLSKYASASARASNAALLGPRSMSTAVHQAEILNLSIEDLRGMIGSGPLMMTFFLTLNDLFTASIPRTTALLRKLDIVAPRGAVLLVIDSIGASSCSASPGELPTQSPGTSNPSYPVDWLLDRVLLGKSEKKVDGREEEVEEQKTRWEKVMEEKMKQHKLNEKLGYPGSLENMKFQLHAYRRL